jgi:catechol 2,3-dioxygenase-like lactoylglutathione lyase family enzyme
VNPFGHVDLRVRDLPEAEAFYERLLPSLGFTARHHGGGWKVWGIPDGAHFAVTESETHVPNENRVAFLVGSREDVERVAEIVGTRPKEMPYEPGYYAIFFADPSGNRLEVYYRPEP